MGELSGPASGGAPTDAEYLLLAIDAALTQARRFVPGTNLTAVDGGAGGDYTLNASASGAPVDASYAVVALNGALTNERRLQPGTGLDLIDGGAGGDLTYQLTGAVLASLALADSALQPGDNVSELVNDAGYITAASLPVGGNPTAQVGLAAINGAAATFMRSDAAPALDQGISPTWTGAHIWTGTDPLVIQGDGKELRFGAGGDDLAIYHDGTNSYIDSNVGHLFLRGSPSSPGQLQIQSTASGLATLEGTAPAYRTYETDAALDEKMWSTGGDASGVWTLRTRADDGSAGDTVVTVARTGTARGTFRIISPFRVDELDANINNVLRSGTYTPTITNVANVAASTARVTSWMRVGNTVTVAGQCSIDPTADAAPTIFRMSLPIASNFNDAFECGGVGADPNTTASRSYVWQISADAANNEAQFAVTLIAGAGNRVITFTFSYEVI